jgi:hypothetical protein
MAGAGEILLVGAGMLVIMGIPLAVLVYLDFRRFRRACDETERVRADHFRSSP